MFFSKIKSIIKKHIVGVTSYLESKRSVPVYMPKGIKLGIKKGYDVTVLEDNSIDGVFLAIPIEESVLEDEGALKIGVGDKTYILIKEDDLIELKANKGASVAINDKISIKNSNGKSLLALIEELMDIVVKVAEPKTLKVGSAPLPPIPPGVDAVLVAGNVPVAGVINSNTLAGYAGTQSDIDHLRTEFEALLE